MIGYYQIRSPLTQITEERMLDYIARVSAAVGEPLERVGLEEYAAEDFALLYVASGGSEGYFIQVFDSLKARPCYILTSGDSNSLAASMEILSYIRSHGGKGEILHGDVDAIAARIVSLKAAWKARAFLRGKNLGLIGKPSDWLISSAYSPAAIMERLGMGFVELTVDELVAEIEKKEYCPNKWTELLLTKDFDREELQRSLYVYGAVKRLCEKYQLSAVSVRCFDLLDRVHTTGCMALAILNAEGICGGCEGDVPALLSMAVLQAVSGKPGFLCNPSRFDLKEKTALFAHCTIPMDMPRCFELDTHFESGIGVAVKGLFAEGDCTVFKCAGDLSRYHVQEGTIIDRANQSGLCRTQISVALDDFSYFLTQPIGNHHIICRGRWAQAVDDLFGII